MDQRPERPVSILLPVNSLYFLPPVDGKESSLGPFRETVSARNKEKIKGAGDSRREIRESKGRGQGIKKKN